jgi:Tfp pilus assembly protein PilN
MTELNSTIPTVQGPKKSTPIGMIVTAIVLGVALIFLIYMYFDKKNKMIEMETALTQEKDSLANELRHMVVAYDTLKTNSDSLKAGVQRQKNKIVQLLSINASNV